MQDLSERGEAARNAVINYSDNLVKVAFSYLKNMSDAEEVAQDVFLAYLQSAPVFASGEHEKAWLIRTTINKCKNRLKSGWFRRRAAMPDNLGELPRDEHTVLQEVMSLDVKYRVPIHLHYYEGYSLEEIADMLHSKPATVGTWLARGRKMLRSVIGGGQA
ncbi:RNA polymerase subunit sigma-24 [Paenibacillus sp. MY03]|uniref:RNA polymerase sigma factor n=1 Tax=Paenibacillus sp. MY03 TaxID=302980 RepID=UPI000B3D2989|nr:sigma-70 family RNA polymerase sigma factor [Paenibacillus sp. MY03]OUS74880.1 RNA polymerase subunit sigma-24 [Paenibacillus sp. MY03]